MRTPSKPIACLAGTTGLLLTFAGAAPARQVPGSAESGVKFFESKVRPLLYEHCFSCHGATKQMGGLRLDTREGVLKGGSRGAAVAPGDAAASRIIQVVRYDGDLKMPPAGKLSGAEISILTDWIRRGAVWPESFPAKPIQPSGEAPLTLEQRRFWSFQPVRSPEVPTGSPISAKSGPRVGSVAPIDAFLLRDLSKKGLAAAPLANKRTLIRRATFDLTGLPPTPADVEAFVSDQSPSAFEKVVDRLLMSPRYGERWGRHWLDLVRYCDSLDARSLGAPGDIGEAWRYRDWVIEAFNRDLPYTEFIKDQVAGDLRPMKNGSGFNRAGLIATTLLAIGNWGNGDADKEKIHTDIVDDQIDVIGRGFLGLTIGCARCHNHKFDPLSQRDYYGLAGIFFSTHILAKFTPKGAGEDIMRTPIASPAELDERKSHAARIVDLEQQVKAAQDARKALIAQRLKPEASRYLLAAWEFHNRPREMESLSVGDFAKQKGLQEFAVRQWLDFAGMAGYRVMNQSVRDVLGAPGVFAWRGAEDTPSALINTTADAKMLLTFTLPPRSVTVHPSPTAGVVVSWRSPFTGSVRLQGECRDADPACGDGVEWKVQATSTGGARPLAAGSFENGGSQPIVIPSPDPIRVRAGDSVQFLVLPKGGHACDTTIVNLKIMEAGGTRSWDLASDMQDDPTSGNPHRDRLGNAGVWSFLDMANTGPAAIQGPLSVSLNAWRDVAARPGSSATDREKAAASVASVFDLSDSRSPFWPAGMGDLAGFPDPSDARTLALAAELAELQKKTFPPLEFANSALDGGIPETPYAGFHDARIHVRGNYARQTEIVARSFPAVLGGGSPIRIEKGSGRLELADWLASDRQPLTARVMVNRVWQHHFGEGIVRTPSNFGFLGERPSNPELLDWLASEFTRQGWSIKKLHRLIMLSQAYRRSSVASDLAMRIDPDNRLFGRQNRRRLEAEAVRDSLLVVSGKLDLSMGGPAVRDFNVGRRTVYGITIRSDRTGFGPLFDAADTTSPIDRRTVSIVAPQALFMLNDRFVLDQAKAVAVRLREQKIHDGDRITSAYGMLFGRPPSETERRVGLRTLAAAGNDGGTASLPEASLKAWETYCLVLLCSNEFIFVD